MKNDKRLLVLIMKSQASHMRLCKELIVLDDAGMTVAAAKLSEVCSALEREIELQATKLLGHTERLSFSELFRSEAASSSRIPLR
jgi:hypothetical protein